jgi:hypothetical protein
MIPLSGAGSVMINNFLSDFLYEDLSHFAVEEAGFDEEHNILLEPDTVGIFSLCHRLTLLKVTKS